MMFFCGLHHPADAKHIQRAFISINALRGRKSDIGAADSWIMDSGAFTTIAKHGGYPHSPSEYAAEIRRWSKSPGLLAAVSQDYMCEPVMLAKTGLTVADHQRLTIERYDAILAAGMNGVYLMPALQGYAEHEYVDHIRQYGDRLKPRMWVGVGSICKRNASPSAIVGVLSAIKRERPDLRLHGFGIKKTSLQIATIVDLLYSGDSMAWSFAARFEGRNRNCWREAKRFAEWITAMPQQTEMSLELEQDYIESLVVAPRE